MPDKEKCVQSHVGRIRLVFFKFSLKEEEELFISFSYRFSTAMRVSDSKFRKLKVS